MPHVHLQVREAVSQVLAEGPEPEQVAVACRFLAHMLSVLRCADRLYGSAVQAAVQLAAEVEQDVQEMLRLGADLRCREQVSVSVWGGITASVLSPW